MPTKRKLAMEGAEPGPRQRPIYLVPTGLPGNDWTLDEDVPALGAPVWGFTSGSRGKLRDICGGALFLMSTPGTNRYNRLGEVDRVLYDRADIGKSLWGPRGLNYHMGGEKKTDVAFTIIVTFRRMITVDSSETYFWKDRVKGLLGINERDHLQNTRHVKPNRGQMLNLLQRCCSLLEVDPIEWSEKPQRPLPPTPPCGHTPGSHATGPHMEDHPSASTGTHLNKPPSLDDAIKPKPSTTPTTSEEDLKRDDATEDGNLTSRPFELKEEPNGDGARSASADDDEVIVILDSDSEDEGETSKATGAGGAGDAEPEAADGSAHGHSANRSVEETSVFTPPRKATGSACRAPASSTPMPPTAPERDVGAWGRSADSPLPAIKLERKLGEEMGEASPVEDVGADEQPDAEHGGDTPGSEPGPQSVEHRPAPEDARPTFQPVILPEQKFAFKAEAVLDVKPDPSYGGSRLWLVRWARQPSSADSWVRQDDLAEECPQLLIRAMSSLLAEHEKAAQAESDAPRAKQPHADGRQPGGFKRPRDDRPRQEGSMSKTAKAASTSGGI